MKSILTLCFGIVSLITVVAIRAQNPTPNISDMKAKIIYQSPSDGDVYVPQRTTLGIRFSGLTNFFPLVQHVYFSVIGEKSGAHSGEVNIAADNTTLIFTPNQPFAINENVNVLVKIDEAANITPFSYHFSTTTMTEQERGFALLNLQERERAEIQSAQTAFYAKQDGLPVGQVQIQGIPVAGVIDTATQHYAENIFFSPTGQFPAPYAFLAIISDTGSSALFERNILKGTGNFRMQPDGTLSYFRQYSSPRGGVFTGVIDHLDTQMHLIDSFQCGNGYLADLHDFQLLANHHAILLAYDPQWVNMDSLYPGKNYSKHAKVFGAIIQELDQNKQVTFEWKSWDHFAISDATHENLADTIIDYMHINAALLDPADGNIFASFRHTDEISKINRTDKSFIWRWGGKHNQFAFVGDTLPFSHQHDPVRIKNGHVTLWDNGNFRLKDTIINGKDTIVNRPFSRADEYVLDEVQHMATLVWSYDNVPFSAAAGNVQRLDNGNTMIGCGIISQPSAVEIDAAKNIVFQLSLPNGAFSYRTYRFPFNLPSSVKPIGKAGTFSFNSIYPNPASNSAIISFASEMQGMYVIEISDVLGKVILRTEKQISASGDYSTEIDLRGIPAGMYYCRLNIGWQSSMKPIIIQR